MTAWITERTDITVSSGSTTVGSVSTGQLDADNIRIDGNTISSTDTNGAINLTPDGTGDVNVTTMNIAGPTIATKPSVTNLADDGEIPITATYANIDANSGVRTGIRFAGAGTAGQILIVENSGGETLTFHNTESTALLRGIVAAHDTMPANFVGLFVSDGARWNLIAGGIDTQPDVGLTAP